MYGLPGQYLVWPGEFVFGYPKAGADPLLPGQLNLPGPAWSANGSYVVFRRLRQDVAAFWKFVTGYAQGLSKRPGFEGVSGEWLAARVLGRWPSGAPVARLQDADDEALGINRLANNNFGFAAPAEAVPLARGGTSNHWPQAGADPVGLTCPMAAHIRKVNARECPSNFGGRRASFNRRILRRGLPYGPRLENPLGPDPDDGRRGLLFLSYQASIADQFEFLCNDWMNSPTNPRSPSGDDMMLGQNAIPNAAYPRQRSCHAVRLRPERRRGHHDERLRDPDRRRLLLQPIDQRAQGRACRVNAPTDPSPARRIGITRDAAAWDLDHLRSVFQGVIGLELGTSFRPLSVPGMDVSGSIRWSLCTTRAMTVVTTLSTSSASGRVPGSPANSRCPAPISVGARVPASASAARRPSSRSAAR